MKVSETEDGCQINFTGEGFKERCMSMFKGCCGGEKKNAPSQSCCGSDK